MGSSAPQAPAVFRGEHAFARRLVSPRGHGLDHPAGLPENEQGPGVIRKQLLREYLKPRVSFGAGVAALQQVAHLAKQVDFGIAVLQLLSPEHQAIVRMLELQRSFRHRGFELLALGNVEEKPADIHPSGRYSEINAMPGTLYNGELNKAIWLFLGFAFLSVPGIALISLYLPDGWMMPTLLLSLALTLICWGYGTIDAWRCARSKQDYMPLAWQVSGMYMLVLVLCNGLALSLLFGYVRAH